jgi:predicted PurR-regulated permease PerM
MGARAPLAPAVFTMLLLITVLAPLVSLLRSLSALFHVGSSYLSAAADAGFPLPHYFDALPFHDQLAGAWSSALASARDPLALANHVSREQLTPWLSAVLGHVSSDIVAGICMLIGFYHFLKHGDALIEWFRRAVQQWFGTRGLDTSNHAVLALRGTINGIVLIGFLEGLMLAVPLWAGGIQSALLVGLLAGILGVIPLVTPLLILPCAGYLLLDGKEVWGVLTIVDLMVCWLVFENYLKPSIISAAVRVNPFLILAALIGGLQLFGPVGLFVGPALMAITAGIVRGVSPSVNIEQATDTNVN